MAEREGFEPSIRFPAYTRSRRAPSTTRPPLRIGTGATYTRVVEDQAQSSSWQPVTLPTPHQDHTRSTALELDTAVLLDRGFLDCFHLSLEASQFCRHLSIAFKCKQGGPEQHHRHARQHRIVGTLVVLVASHAGRMGRHTPALFDQLLA